MIINKIKTLTGLSFCLLAGCAGPHSQDKSSQRSQLSPLRISDNSRYFMARDGEPFFWMGDTGWLLLSKLDRENTERYLDDRREKGFNVIQAMLLHELDVANAYGDTALSGQRVDRPDTTAGNDFADSLQYDYWDHVDYVIDKAAEKGFYMALVPVWGSNVRGGGVNQEQAQQYASFLSERYGKRSNVIWLNGGDVRGDDSMQVWKTIGQTLRANCPGQLITFHPFGRTASSLWFHEEPWLDFNMFQSGHRRYDQDMDTASLRYGEDNWRYIKMDYQKTPVKPTLDGEPSYESIPQGLHDTTQPYWTADEVRRYAYWSVFSGGCGFTYGHNAVMQMHHPGDADANFGVKEPWYEALDAPGASQMVHLKDLMLSRPYFERVPDQSLIARQGERHDYQAATRAEDYAFVYTWNGRTIQVNMGKIAGQEVKAGWYDPRTGAVREIGAFANQGVQEFDPPGAQQDGNDWVLILDSIE